MAARFPRPLSPHLQVYRLPLTALLSITHRVTGAILALGLFALVGAILAIAGAGGGYRALQGFINSFIGQGVLLLWMLALYLHFCHGIRHLLWDLGWGFGRERQVRYGWLELAAGLVLTLLSWLLL